MKAKLTFTPASVFPQPSVKKYYGVCSKGYETGNLRDRAFIVALRGFPKPSRFHVIHGPGCTMANNWSCIAELEDSKEFKSLSEYIAAIMAAGFVVIEFDNARELFTWVADCEEMKS